MGAHGLYFYIGDAGSSMTAVVSANTVTGSTGHGILGYAYTNAAGTFTLSGNTVSGSGDAGIRIRTYNSAMSNVTITDNVLTGNGTKTASSERYGLYLWTDYYAQSTFLVNGNRVGIESDDTTLNGNGTDGIYVYTYNQAVINGTVTGNTLTANARHGLYTYQQSNNGTSTLLLDGNTTYGNGSYGLYTNSYYTNLNLTVSGNAVYGNTYGIYARSDSNSSYRLNALISGNDVHDNSQAGITCYANRQGQVYPEIRGNLVYDNTGAGIQCNRNTSQAYTSYIMPIVAVLNTVRNNGSDGIYLQSSSFAKASYNNTYLNGGYDFNNGSSLPVDARFGYWGIVTTPEMNLAPTFADIQKIYDIFDDPSRGRINYLEWFDSGFDTTGPRISKIIFPLSSEVLSEGALTIEGIAHAENGIDRIEVSLDGGASWEVASFDSTYPGKTLWHFDVEALYAGIYTIISRVVDENEVQESPGDSITLTVDSDEPTTFGTLEWDETWSGLVNLEGDVVVPEGVTLTIQPGTTISFPAKFDASYGGSDINRTEFVVHGTLLAEGTELAPIVLSSGAASPGRGDWVGLKGTGAIYLEYVTVEYSTYGVDFTGNSDFDELQVYACTIQHTSVDGISAYVDGGLSVQVTIESSTITDNDRYGIYGRSYGANTVLDASISENSITANGNKGIYLYAQGNNNNPEIIAWVANNTIDGHQDQGIYTYTYYGGISDLTIDNNTVSNSGTGIYVDYGTAAASSAVTVSNNTVHTQAKGVRVRTNNSHLSPLLENNIVYGHTEDGIFCEYINSTSYNLLPTIIGNQVYNNTTNGFYLNCTQVAEVHDNGLYDNAGYDLYNNSASGVSALDNWWGTGTTNDMNAGSNPQNIAAIFDSLDDGGKGAVDYDSWITVYNIPADPTLSVVTSPTAAASQLLSGTKEADTAIFLNGTQIVGSNALTTWGYDLSLAEGRNPIAIYARSTDGLTTGVVISEITRDTTAPLILSSVPAGGQVLNRTLDAVTITMLEKDTSIDTAATLAGATVLVDGDANVSGSWTLDGNSAVFTPASAIGEGTYTVTIHPTDSPLGNTRVATITFTIDLTIPSTPTLDPAASPTNVATQTISGGKDAGTAIWLNGMEIVASDGLTTWSYDLSIAFEGTNSYELSARDEAGNRSAESGFSIVLDRVPPAFQFSNPQDGIYTPALPATIEFTFLDQTTGINETASVATGLVEDSQAQTVVGVWALTPPGSLAFTPTTPLGEDSYSAGIDAVDLAGNTTSRSISFTYDGTSPAAPTLDSVESPTHLDHQTLSGTKDTQTSVWINGLQVVPLDSATIWFFEFSLAEGDNVLSVSAKDRAGNESPTAGATIIYDDIAPKPVTLSADASGIGTTVALDWTGYDEAGQEDVASYHVYVDTGLFTQLGNLTPVATLPAGTFTYEMTGLVTGTQYYFAVVAEDTNGNAATSATPISATPIDTVPPEFTGLDWVDLDTSEAVSEGDQYIFHFSEAMYAGVIQNDTTDANTHLVPEGGTIYGTTNVVSWSGDGRDLTLTVTAGFTIIGDESVTPGSSVTDLAGNPVTGTQQLQGRPIIAPDIISVRFDDADGNGTVSLGDRFFFTFDEPILPGSLSDGTTEANLNMSPEGKKYGDINTITWNNDFTEVNIEITAGFTIIGNEIVDPSDLVTDADDNPVENTGILNLVDVIGPEVEGVQAFYISPLSATDNYKLTVQFNSAMDATMEPVVTLTSSGSTDPVVPTGGQWLTTRYSNDTYTTPNIVLSQGMDGTLTADVNGARDWAGNLMLPAPDVFTALLDATPPNNPVVTVSSVDCDAATLSWNGYTAPGDLAGFQVYLTTDGIFSTVDGSSFIDQIGPSARSYVLGALTTETSYHAAVVAMDSVGNLTPTVTSHPIFIAQPVPPATNITVEAGNNPDDAVISWTGYNTDGLCGFAGFRVYMEEADFSAVSGLTPVATLDELQGQYTVSALDRSKTYYFAVVGFNQTDAFTETVTTASWSDPYTGEITMDTTIGAGDQKEIAIDQTIVITSGAILTIEPGTTLYFATGMGIEIQSGALIADGTALFPIILTSDRDQSGDSPAPGDWTGVTISGADTGSQLSHVFIKYGQGLTIDGSHPLVAAYTGLSNSGPGLSVLNGGALTTSEALLQYNDIGASIESGGQLNISGSVIKYNGVNASSDINETMIANGNWWGSADAAIIESSLTGDVDYTGFLDYEPILTPAIDTFDGETEIGTNPVDLILAGRNAEEMRISEDSAFTGIFFKDFQSTETFILSAGGGTKTVFAQFRSPTGTESTPIPIQVDYITDGPLITSFNLNEGQEIHRPIYIQGEASSAPGLSVLEFYVDDALVADTVGAMISYLWDVREAGSGLHRVKLLAQDTLGNIATTELNVLLTIEPPPAPVISEPANETIVNGGTVILRGTAEPFASLKLRRDGFVVGSLVAEADGTFEVADIGLLEGNNRFIAIAEDSIGLSAGSNVVDVILDSGAPPAPVLLTVDPRPGVGVQLEWRYAVIGERPTHILPYTVIQQNFPTSPRRRLWQRMSQN